jgi:hypothetical protein
LEEVRQRLAALRAELNRLDGDQTVFARAFHTHVARTVLEALAADEARLAALPFMNMALGDLSQSTASSSTSDVGLWSDSSPTGRREVLDV